LTLKISYFLPGLAATIGEQVGVGVDPALYIFFSSGLIRITFLILSGDFQENRCNNRAFVAR
jgi:hypothetical protein